MLCNIERRRTKKERDDVSSSSQGDYYFGKRLAKYQLEGRGPQWVTSQGDYRRGKYDFSGELPIMRNYLDAEHLRHNLKRAEENNMEWASEYDEGIGEKYLAHKEINETLR